MVRVNDAYDGLGRRIGRQQLTWDAVNEAFVTAETLTYAYDGSARLLELDLADSGDVVRQYLNDPASGEILAIDQADPVANNTKDLWAFADPNGNLATVATVATVDFVGAWSVVHRRYDDFGNVAATFGDTGNANLVAAPQQWSGLFADAATGLYDAQSRGWYDPQIGRYLTDTGGINGYRAFGNQPANVVKSSISLDDFEGPSPFSGVLGNTVGRGTHALFGETLTNASDVQLGLGIGIGAAAAIFGGEAVLGSLGLIGAGTTAAETSFFAAGTTAVAYASLGVSGAQVAFSGGAEGKLNLAFDAFGVGFLRHANTARGLFRSGLFAADVGFNTAQGVLGTTDAISAFRQGNVAGGVLSAAGGLLGFAGAGLGSRNLSQLLRTDPFANPLNFVTFDPFTTLNSGAFGTGRVALAAR